MYLKGIRRKNVIFILECLRWNEYTFSQKNPEDCWNKNETLEDMKNVRTKLKEAIS